MPSRPAIQASTMAATAPDVVRSLLRMATAAIVLLVAVGAPTVLHRAAAAVPPPDAAQHHGVTVSVNQHQVRALRSILARVRTITLHIYCWVVEIQ